MHVRARRRAIPAALLWLVALALTAGGCATAASPARSARGTGPASPARSKRRHTTACPPWSVRTIRLFDWGAPHGSRYAQTFTPPVAHPGQLPVLYFLHGYPGGGDNIGGGPTATTLREQVCAGARPFVLVAPDGNAADRSDTEWSDAADGRFHVESFVTGRLISAVEGRSRRPARLRAIAGFSMGGYGAADLALRHPDLYRQFVSIGGYYTIDDPSGTFGYFPTAARTINRRAHEPLLLTAAAAGMRVMLTDGTRDRQKLYARQVARFAPRLRASGATVETLTVTLPHTYAMVQAVIPALVRFLEVGWARPAAG